jgi:hypothetical protein
MIELRPSSPVKAVSNEPFKINEGHVALNARSFLFLQYHECPLKSRESDLAANRKALRRFLLCSHTPRNATNDKSAFATEGGRRPSQVSRWLS